MAILIGNEENMHILPWEEGAGASKSKEHNVGQHHACVYGHCAIGMAFWYLDECSASADIEYFNVYIDPRNKRPSPTRWVGSVASVVRRRVALFRTPTCLWYVQVALGSTLLVGILFCFCHSPPQVRVVESALLESR